MKWATHLPAVPLKLQEAGRRYLGVRWAAMDGTNYRIERCGKTGPKLLINSRDELAPCSVDSGEKEFLLLKITRRINNNQSPERGLHLESLLPPGM
jgi:hypothetical protein